MPVPAPTAAPKVEPPPIPKVEIPVVAEVEPIVEETPIVETPSEPVAFTPPAPAMPKVSMPIAPKAPTYEESIPTFNLDQPLPVSALDGFMLDDNEILNAIGEMDSNSLEAQSDILEAVEVLSAPVAAPVTEETVPVYVPEPVAPAAMVEEALAPPVVVLPTVDSISMAANPIAAPAPIAPPIPSAETPKPGKSKSNIKHGFDF
jgi:hypothetical protein